MKVLDALQASGVRFGVYKNTDLIEAGLAGQDDLDLLVDARDRFAFHSVMQDCGGISGACSPLYDNAVAGREDWFLPMQGAGFLHFDVCFGLQIGRKFHKHYPALAFGDVVAWRQALAGEEGGLTAVTAREEARIAVLRSIFRISALPFASWMALDRDACTLLARAWPSSNETIELAYTVGDARIVLRVRLHQGRYEIDAKAIRRLRKLLRREAGAPFWAPVSDFLMHHAKRLAFAVARRWTAGDPARSVAKRRLQPQGVVIALIGPDGVGKSTQVRRLVEQFGAKFRCTSIYLGSNDGAWMRYRGALKGAIGKKRVDSRSADQRARRRAKKRGVLHNLGSAVWRLTMAVQRLNSLRRVSKLSRQGAIVFTDRWPQNLEHGFLDGPSVPPPPGQRLARGLWRVEMSVYRKIMCFRPTQTVHLDCDFSVSNARKPGDIEEEDFEKRIQLMRRMRELDPSVRVVDARQEMGAVTDSLFRAAWSTVQCRSGSSPR